ncbi:MAG: hypothetical protein PHQ44_05050 [Anaerovibrio sp.]|nr:hypothetical protein [Anaerovibrio sp.]
MFDKNHLTGNGHLRAETAGDFAERMKKERPELAKGVDKLRELLDEEVYKRAFSNIQTFNRRDDVLLIVSGGILQRSFLERDCIPALKEAFEVKRVQIIG